MAIREDCIDVKKPLLLTGAIRLEMSRGNLLAMPLSSPADNHVSEISTLNVNS